MNQNTGGQRAGSGKRAELSAALFAAIAVAACGSTAATNNNDASSGDTAVETTIGSIVRGTPQPCTEPHSICVNAKIPAGLGAGPTKMQIDFYEVVPPAHAPDGLPLIIPMPELIPGETVQLRMTDLGMTGTYYFFGLIFMPGGGYQIPVENVDYTGNSQVAYTFTGAALNMPETLDFQLLVLP